MTSGTNTLVRERKDANGGRRKILLVDDHPILREGLCRRINDEPDLMVCGESASASEALACIAQLMPDLAIIDISLKESNGLDLLKSIQSLHPGLLTLVLSMHDESFYAERALRVGARGYIMKEEPPQKLIDAIHQVLNGELIVSEEMAHRILKNFSGHRVKIGGSPLDQFTNREFETFHLIGQGLTTRQIADRLHVSAKTVEVHRVNIKRKLRVSTGPELIRYAVQWYEANR